MSLDVRPLDGMAAQSLRKVFAGKEVAYVGKGKLQSCSSRGMCSRVDIIASTSWASVSFVLATRNQRIAALGVVRGEMSEVVIA